MKDQVGNIVEAIHKQHQCEISVTANDSKILLPGLCRRVTLVLSAPPNSRIKSCGTRIELTRDSAIALAHILLTLTEA